MVSSAITYMNSTDNSNLIEDFVKRTDEMDYNEGLQCSNLKGYAVMPKCILP